MNGNNGSKYSLSTDQRAFYNNLQALNILQNDEFRFQRQMSKDLISTLDTLFQEELNLRNCGNL